MAVRLCAEVNDEILSIAASAASEAARRKRFKEHYRHVTETLHARSLRRPGPLVPGVVDRPITGSYAVTQKSVEYLGLEASRIERNEWLTLMRRPMQL